MEDNVNSVLVVDDDIVVENNEVCEPEEIVDEQVKSKKKVTYNTLDESFAKLEQEFVEIKTSLSNFRIHLRDLRKDMRRYVKDVSKRNRKRVDDGVLPPKQNPKVVLDHSGEGLRDASGQKREISNPYIIYHVLSTSTLSKYYQKVVRKAYQKNVSNKIAQHAPKAA